MNRTMNTSNLITASNHSDLSIDFINRYVTAWFLPCVLFVGVSGNLLCLVVLIKKSPFPRDVQNWFVVFCIAEIYVLLTSGVDFYLFMVLDIRLREMSEWACKLTTGLYYTGFFMVCWTQTAISMLRAYATAKPMKRGIIVTNFRTDMALILLFIVIVLFCALSAICLIHYSPPQVEGNSTDDQAYYSPCYSDEAFVVIDYIFKDVIPFLLMFCSSLVVITGLRQAMARYQISQYQRRMTMTLLGMNFTYVLANPTFNTYNMLYVKHVIQHSNEEYLRTVTILSLLTYLDFATNWLFFFMLGKRFRKYLRIAFQTAPLCGAGSSAYHNPAHRHLPLHTLRSYDSHVRHSKRLREVRSPSPRLEGSLEERPMCATNSTKD